MITKRISEIVQHLSALAEKCIGPYCPGGTHSWTASAADLLWPQGRRVARAAGGCGTLNGSRKFPERAYWSFSLAERPARWRLSVIKVCMLRKSWPGNSNLAVPVMPWHAQRDIFVEFAGWLSLVTGSLAKMAQDVILMTQTEVGEVGESGEAGRGGSSTMPQKSNPITSELIIAAARTNAALLSALHQGQIQEHERATHGWQVEWLTLPQMVLLTGGALKQALFLAKNLQVDSAAMNGPITPARQGRHSRRSSRVRADGMRCRDRRRKTS